jgi:ribosomal protein S18 acetylase RimI-like enzyme
MTLRLSLANDHHWELIIRLVEEAAAWLRSKNTDQWSRPWPTRAARDARIWADLTAEKTWILWDGDLAVATITSEEKADPLLSAEWPDGDPAAYVRRLVVARNYAGRRLGSWLLDWAGDSGAASYGALWIRIDVWKTNIALHRYYQGQGFESVGHCNDSDYPSGALFQRVTRQIPAADYPFVVDAHPRTVGHGLRAFDPPSPSRQADDRDLVTKSSGW